MLAIVFSTLFLSVTAQTLNLARNYSGTAFFDLWNYKVGNDVLNFWGDPSNNGVVNFTDPVFAQEQNLLFVNSVGNVVVRTDNFTDGTGNSSYVRNSLQLLSKDPITPGTLMIMDAVHMPFGCAVWPAFWMNGGPGWPKLGEIDIVENVNLATTNAYNLHTAQGCMASTQVAFTGDLVHLDCFNGTDHDTGCKVVDSTLSYGEGFASNGGGAFAFLWNDEGMKIWFWPRGSVPGDVDSVSPDPEGWGLPTAFYPMATCDMPKFFGPQTLIIVEEINVCGNFAVDKFSDTCSAQASQCTDLVPIPSTFDNAYFEIRYITVFNNSTTLISDNSTTSTSTDSSGTSVNSATSAVASGSTPISTAATKSSAIALQISFAGVLSVLLFMISLL